MESVSGTTYTQRWWAGFRLAFAPIRYIAGCLRLLRYRGSCFRCVHHVFHGHFLSGTNELFKFQVQSFQTQMRLSCKQNWQGHWPMGQPNPTRYKQVAASRCLWVLTWHARARHDATRSTGSTGRSSRASSGLVLGFRGHVSVSVMDKKCFA